MAVTTIEYGIVAALVLAGSALVGGAFTDGIGGMAGQIAALAGTETQPETPPEPAGPTAEQIAFQDWYNAVEAMNQTDCGATTGATWGGWPPSGSGCDAKEYNGTSVDTLIWW